MPPSFASLAALLKSLAPRFGLETRLVEMHLTRDWPLVVGDQIARHTRPGSIRFKKLYLIAQSSVWVQQLAFLKPALIEKVNAAAGAPVITEIALRVGEIPRNDSSGEVVRSDQDGEPVPSAANLSEAAAHTQGVQDPELRAQVTQVLARMLALPERSVSGPAKDPRRRNPPASAPSDRPDP